MPVYNFVLSAKWSPEVGRSSEFDEEELTLDELYPDEMDENTDGPCPLVSVEQGIFPHLAVEGDNGERFEIEMNPFGEKGEAISYEDKGAFFDESVSDDVSWLYVCKLNDSVTWTCELELDEPFEVAKLTVSYRSYIDEEGNSATLIIPEMTYDGEELSFCCEGGEGTDGECAWILSSDGRRVLEQ